MLHLHKTKTLQQRIMQAKHSNIVNISVCHFFKQEIMSRKPLRQWMTDIKHLKCINHKDFMIKKKN